MSEYAIHLAVRHGLCSVMRDVPMQNAVRAIDEALEDACRIAEGVYFDPNDPQDGGHVGMVIAKRIRAMMRGTKT